MREGCPACAEARQRERAAGHRGWRKAACFDCAAVDLDGPWWRDLLASHGIEPVQPVDPSPG